MKKFLYTISILCIIVFFMPIVLSNQNTSEAADIKINTIKKTMYEGETYKLKITGTNRRVYWNSKDESVAKVNSNGTITAKKNGTTTITAQVGNKKFKCKVTVKLLQFNNKFYTIKEASKKYVKLTKLKKNTNYYYDLDGDGKKEKITIEPDTKNSKPGDIYRRYKIKLNGKKFVDLDANLEMYIVDLNKKDKKKEIVIYNNVPNDAHYIVFYKKGKKMKKAGTIYSLFGGLRIDKKGNLLVDDVLLEKIVPKIYDGHYTLKNNKIKYNKINLKKIKNVTFTKKINTFYTDTLDNVGTFNDYYYGDYYEALDRSSTQVIKNITFKILDVKIRIHHPDDPGTHMKVKLDNGEEGYIFEPYWI